MRVVFGMHVAATKLVMFAICAIFLTRAVLAKHVMCVACV